VIQEIGYDCAADIWSLGITALEMAEGKPPYGDIHPMRAIFMIPTKPPPSFREPDQWSTDFIEFVNRCLVKNPDDRATATELLVHPFIVNSAQPATILSQMIAEAKEIRENLVYRLSGKHTADSDDDEADSGTMIHASANEKTLVPSQVDDGTMIGSRTIEGTMIEHNTGTLVPHGRRGHMADDGYLTENLGTMVINSDEEEDADSTMKRHQTAEGASSKSKYRPLFLDHFEKKDAEKLNLEMEMMNNQQQLQSSSPPAGQPITMTPEEQKRFESNLQRQLNQISAGSTAAVIARSVMTPNEEMAQVAPVAVIQPAPPQLDNPGKMQRPFMDGDFEFLKFLSHEELQQRMTNLDSEMEREIYELRRRYQAKRQPIIDAIDQKKKRQQNF